MDRETSGRRTADVDLMNGGANPAEQPAVMEDRSINGNIILMDRANPGVIAKKHVTVFDPRTFGTVMERPSDHRFKHDALIEQIRCHKHDVAIFVSKNRHKIIRFSGHRRSRDATNGDTSFVADMPK